MKPQDTYDEIVDKLSQMKENDERLDKINNFIEKQDVKQINRESNNDTDFDYESIISQISEAVYNGFVCYLNPETMEIEQVDGEADYEPLGAEYGEQNEDMIDEFGLSYTEWDNYIRFEPFGRDDTLNRMEDFLEQVDDTDIRSELEDIEDNDELFEQFPILLDKAGYTEEWENFKRNEIESYVRSQVMSSLSRTVDTDEDIYSQ